MLVGITGHAQHGKDTAAQALVDELGYIRLGFADALKDLALRVSPVITLSFHDPSVTVRLADHVRRVGWENAKKLPEVRRVLQELGTGARDIIGENVWVDAIERQMLSAPGPVVISDVRFPNEAVFIRRWHGVLIKVHRPKFDNGVGTDHPSEAFVDTLSPDVVLYNAGTVSELKEMAVRSVRDRTVTV